MKRLEILEFLCDCPNIIHALKSRYDEVDDDVPARDLTGFINHLVLRKFLRLSPGTAVATDRGEAP